MSEKRPPLAERRLVQITGLLEAMCLRCGSRIKDTATLVSDGREWCRACNSYSYVIPAPAAKIAIVTQVTAHELAYMAQQQMDMPQKLKFLGMSEVSILEPVLVGSARR